MNAERTGDRAAFRYRHSAVTRALAFFLLWLALMQSSKPADLAVGLLAAAAATGLSLRLLPPASGHLDFRQLILLFPHFVWASALAGIDVARRALDPRMPLRCGLVDCEPGFPRGLARNSFATYTSLMPGTVPVTETERALTYHCLDTGQPVLEQLQADARRLAKAVIGGHRHG